MYSLMRRITKVSVVGRFGELNVKPVHVSRTDCLCLSLGPLCTFWKCTAFHVYCNCHSLYFMYVELFRFTQTLHLISIISEICPVFRLFNLTCPIWGNIMVAPPFYNALYGINYRLPNVTYIIAVGIYSVVRVVKRGATMILPNRYLTMLTFINPVRVQQVVWRRRRVCLSQSSAVFWRKPSY